MTQTTQYPEWQKFIREAQAICDDIQRQLALKAEEEKRAKQLEEGTQLHQALAFLGIEALELKENLYEVDGIQFYLMWQGEYTRWLYRCEGNRIRFELAVRHAPPADLEEGEEWPYDVERIFVDSFLDRTDERTGDRALLADAIDAATERYKGEVARRIQRLAQPVMKAAPAPTLDEQLIDLLRRVIRDEINKGQFDV